MSASCLTPVVSKRLIRAVQFCERRAEMLHPGIRRGEVRAELYGELAACCNWARPISKRPAHLAMYGSRWLRGSATPFTEQRYSYRSRIEIQSSEWQQSSDLRVFVRSIPR
jgi:hypothetical protein